MNEVKHRLPRRKFRMIFAFLCLLGTGAVVAGEEMAAQMPIRDFPVGQIFTFLFLMLGPFKVIGPFARMTAGAETALARKIALLGTLFASIALLTAAVLGELILNSYGIPVPVLALAAGLILFLVALINILHQFNTEADGGATAPDPAQPPQINMAMAPLAFPTIVTPYGIAALVVFMALSPGLENQLTIGAIVLAIMLLNLAVMLAARYILPVLGVVLTIIGAVLGVVQVALGLQIINNSLRALGVL